MHKKMFNDFNKITTLSKVEKKVFKECQLKLSNCHKLHHLS